MHVYIYVYIWYICVYIHIKPGTPSQLPTWMAEVQSLGLSSAVFLAPSRELTGKQGSWDSNQDWMPGCVQQPYLWYLSPNPYLLLKLVDPRAYCIPHEAYSSSERYIYIDCHRLRAVPETETSQNWRTCFKQFTVGKKYATRHNNKE